MGILRLLLAISVTLTHADPGLCEKILIDGISAVRLFYIISGFYMALVLNEKYTGPGSTRLFLGNRFLRLLPTYYLVAGLPILASVLGTLWTHRTMSIGGLSHWVEHFHHFQPVTAFLLALCNLTVVGQEFSWAGAVELATGRWIWTDDYFGAQTIPGYHFLVNTPSWTLGIELEFYCLAPLLARLRTSRLMAVFFGSVAFRFILPTIFPALSGFWQSHFLPCELAYFLAGMLSYRVYDAHRNSGQLASLSAKGRFVFPAVLGLILVSPLVPISIRGSVAAVGLAASLPFVFALTGKIKSDRALGELSYPLYLVHWNLAHLWSMMVRYGWLPAFKDPMVSAGLFLLFALVAALVLVLCVELPVNRFRERRRLRAQARIAPAIP